MPFIECHNSMKELEWLLDSMKGSSHKLTTISTNFFLQPTSHEVENWHMQMQFI